MTTKHTPGPWVYEPTDEYHLHNGNPVVALWHGDANGEVEVSGTNRDADALLISAAPDMLTALRLLDDVNLGEYRDAVDAAVNKALGA